MLLAVSLPAISSAAAVSAHHDATLDADGFCQEMSPAADALDLVYYHDLARNTSSFASKALKAVCLSLKAECDIGSDRVILTAHVLGETYTSAPTVAAAADALKYTLMRSPNPVGSNRLYLRAFVFFGLGTALSLPDTQI